MVSRSLAIDHFKNTQVEFDFGSGPIIFGSVMPLGLLHLGLNLFMPPK